jgi:glycosyltransferase involved in cell wall biosynthesis
VDAASQLARPVIFKICGEGPELETLRGEARDFGVADRFEFLGFAEEAKKRQLVAQANLMVHPASFESFGIILLEAIDLGCPVVSTAVGGIPEVVGEGGTLVPPGQPEALARAIDALLRDPNLGAAMSKAGRAHAARFDWAALAPDVERAYAEAVGRRAA